MFVITSFVIFIALPAVYIVLKAFTVTLPNPEAGDIEILLPAIISVTPPCDVEFIVTVPVPSTGVIDMSVPPITLITPVLLIIGSAGFVLSTAIPVPATTDVIVPPPAGTAQTLSPLRKLNELGVPVAEISAVIVTLPFVAVLGVKFIKVPSVVVIVLTGVDHMLSPLKYVELPAEPEADKLAEKVTFPVVADEGVMFIKFVLAALADNTPKFPIVITFDPLLFNDIPLPLNKLTTLKLPASLLKVNVELVPFC